MAVAAEHFPRSTGWQARLALGFRHTHRRTVLAERQRSGPLAVQRAFYPEGDVCHVYLLHPPGGVVGGDSLHIETHVDAGAHALVTTPGATKFYRSAAQLAGQQQRLTIDRDAVLEWLPQENILFPGANVRLDTQVELQRDARIALWEINCLGRPAIAEAFDRGHFDSGLSISRDGQPLLLDRLRIDAKNLSRLALTAGCPVHGTFLIGPADRSAVTGVTDLMYRESREHAAATLVDDLLVVRYLGASTERARRLFIEVWMRLRRQLLGRDPHPPRIWAT